MVEKFFSIPSLSFILVVELEIGLCDCYCYCYEVGKGGVLEPQREISALFISRQ